jgi:putative transposase
LGGLPLRRDPAAPAAAIVSFLPSRGNFYLTYPFSGQAAGVRVDFPRRAGYAECRKANKSAAMARLSRFFLPNQPMHAVHRGKDGRRVFFGKGDYARYRDWLAEAAAKYGCAVHAYALLPNEIHLLVTPRAAASLPRLLQSLGRRHTRQVNAARGLEGPRWEGRYRVAPIEAGTYLLDCQRYIEGLPVRSGLARDAGSYPWSSYAGHVGSAVDALVRDHRLYRDLGATAARRQRSYRALFRKALPKGFVEDLTAATHGGWALGSTAFRRRIAAASGRRVTPLPRGRPRLTRPHPKGRKSR